MEIDSHDPIFEANYYLDLKKSVTQINISMS